ncbi:hypothetical protein MASR2M70_01910 [Bacillota bacterium]
MSRIRFSKGLKKKTFILTSMLLVVLAVGVINGKISERKELAASSEYVNYEEGIINEHDGEVLVDSISLEVLSGSSPASPTNDSLVGAVSETAVIITSDDISDAANADSLFAERRATMDMDRNEILSMLTAVISESGSDPEKDNATKKKLKIIEYMNTEKVIENLIVNKGFAEAFVVMTDSSVNISVNKEELSQSDVAKIMDVVIRETGRAADQIVIQNKY